MSFQSNIVFKPAPAVTPLLDVSEAERLMVVIQLVAEAEANAAVAVAKSAVGHVTDKQAEAWVSKAEGAWRNMRTYLGLA